MLITVLLATYNWPQALALSLQSLKMQTDLDFEIVIVDDGSTVETRRVITECQKDFPVPIRHIWQEDIGFRKSKILNQGIVQAQGNYLVFLDGDCIAQPDFIAQHRQLATPKHLVTGSRILCHEELTKDLIASGIWKGWSSWRVLQWRLQRGINKCLPVFLKVPDNWWI